MNLDLLTTRQFAEACRVSRQTVMIWKAAGIVTPVDRLGDGPTAGWLWSPDDVPTNERG